MFKTTRDSPADHQHHPTKIPVPQSPLPLRRSASLRMKGEAFHYQQYFPPPTLSAKRRSVDANRRPPLLTRGNSFVERRGGGDGPQTTPQPRGRDLTTESKSKGSSPTGADALDADAGRTRSLVSPIFRLIFSAYLGGGLAGAISIRFSGEL